MNKLIADIRNLLGRGGRMLILLLPVLLLAGAAIYLLAGMNHWLKDEYVNVTVAGIIIVIAFLIILPVFYFLLKEIERRKKLGRELKLQREQLHTILSSVAEGLITCDLQGEIIYANPRAEQLCGWSFSEMKNQPLEKIFRVTNEATGQPLENIVSRILSMGEAIALENNTVLHTRHSGNIIISNNGAPLRDESGKIYGAVLVFRDVTEKMKAEAELHHKTFILSQAQRIAGIGNWKLDLASGTVTWSDEMYNIYAVPAHSFKPTHEAFLQLVHPDDRALMIQAIEKTINKEKQDDLEFRILCPDGTERIISGNGKLFFDEQGKAQYMVGTAQNITERKKAEQELRLAHQRLTSHLNNSPVGVIEWDKNFNIRQWSVQAEKIFGWRKEEVLGKHFNDLHLVFEADGPAVAEVALELAEGRVERNISFNRNYKKSGAVIFCKWYNSVLKDDAGNIVSILSLIEDITERKKAEETLMASERKLQRTLDDMLEGVLVIGFDYKYIYLNNLALQTSGYSKEELIGHTMMEKYPGVKQTDVFKAITRCLNERVPQHIETEFTFPGGNKGWFQVSVQPVEEGTFVLYIDITDRKNAEEEKWKALERYDILAQATSDTIWHWDIVNNKMLYNHGISKMFGYNISEIENLHQWWERNIHPEDAGRVTELLREAFERKKQNIQLEYRYRCANHSYKQIFDRAYAEYDETGKPFRMIGAMQDISHRKEEELRINKAIIDAQETERQQIGMELHDNVNQILSAVMMYMGMITKQQHDAASIKEMLSQSKKYLGEAIKEIRQLSHQLAPASFESVSMQDVIVSLVNAVNAGNLFHADLDFKGLEKIKMPGELQVNIYRILQEQLNNIIKYAEASRVEISLTKKENTVHLRVADNGKGFDPKTVKRGIGLENIRRRVKMLNGEFILWASPGNGCVMVIELPLKND